MASKTPGTPFASKNERIMVDREGPSRAAENDEDRQKRNPSASGEGPVPAASAEKNGTLRKPRATNHREVRERLALFSVRTIFFVAAAGLGYAAVGVLGPLTRRDDLVPTTGVLIACITAVLIIVLETRLSKSPIGTISAITFGVVVGLVLSLVLSPVVAFIAEAFSPLQVRVDPSFQALQSFLRLLTTTLLCYFCVSILLQTKDDFRFIIPYVEFRRDVRGRTPLLVDTSCFVDGRIQALLSTNALDYRLVVPKFVLEELQQLADSANRSTRERGRRGMDILREIESVHHVEITDHTLGPGEEVDAQLIELAAEDGAKLITNDYNLQKNAMLQGIAVINVHDLATALKPDFVPGDRVEVKLLREGDERNQAVGFLSDGTMVVVEDARNRIGQEVQVEVTSSLQTHAGRMIFGRLRSSGKEN